MTKEEIIQSYVEKMAEQKGISCEEAKELVITQEYIKYIEKEGNTCQTQSSSLQSSASQSC